MPTIHRRHRYVQRASHSDPFIVSMSLHDMLRFSRRIVDGKWPDLAVKGILESLLPPDGVMTAEIERKFNAARKAADDFDSGSARLSVAHDGRYWATAKTWSRHVPWWPQGSTVPRRLTPDEVTLLLHSQCDESGFHALYKFAPDITDGCRALAWTVLAWARSIEEAWPEEA